MSVAHVKSSKEQKLKQYVFISLTRSHHLISINKLNHFSEIDGRHRYIVIKVIATRG